MANETQSSSSSNWWRSIRQSVIGAGTSAAAIALTFPSDTITRQLHVTPRGDTSWSLIRATWCQRGLRGFYRGLTPALVTQPTFWAVYFPAHKELERFADWLSIESCFARDMALGYSAGCVSAIVTNPLWVMRQRMQTEIVRNNRLTYLELARVLHSENGVATFFRGLNITLIKNVQMALLLPLYNRWNRRQKNDGESWLGMLGLTAGSTGAIMASGIMAKIASSAPIYPLDVVRTNVRCIEHQSSLRTWDVVKMLYRQGGALNFFRGFGWYCAGSGLMFGLMMQFKELVD